VFQSIIVRMRWLVRNRRYVMTLHAEDEMCSDGLTVRDVEMAVLAGGIVRRQKDQQTGEWKYRIRGKSCGAEPMEVVAKIGRRVKWS
jgi:hypothetical protein